MGLRFSKMHGLGNDFVDRRLPRARRLPLDAAAIRRLGDRHFGVGFDQLLTIERARDAACAFAYGIWNTDGSRAGQCGNGVRCVARWLVRAGALARPASTRLESPSGPVAIELLADGRVRADMGEPRFAPAAIPLVAEEEHDRYRIDVAGREVEVGAVSMGNPHAVVEVDDVDAAPVEALGPQIEHADAFPERCNVGFAKVGRETRSRCAYGSAASAKRSPAAAARARRSRCCASAASVDADVARDAARRRRWK